MASDALKIVSHGDGDSAKKPPARVGEPSPAEEIDPIKLVDLLGDIDGLKHEIHERMRRMEAVKQAKSLLLEDAQKTEALNKKLEALGKVMNAVHSGLQTTEGENVDVARMPVRNEGAALPWPRPDDATIAPVYGCSPEDARLAGEARIALDAASARMEQAHEAWKEAEKRVDEATVEAKRLFDESASRLDLAANKEELAAIEFRNAQEALTAALAAVNERLEEADQRWRQTEAVAFDAKRLWDETSSHLDRISRNEEQAGDESSSAQQALAASLQSTNERLYEIERNWKQVSQAALAANHLLEESKVRLEQAANKEEQVTTDIQALQKTLTASYQSASKRLEEAERFWRDGDAAVTETKKHLEQATFQLTQSHAKEEAAEADLKSARQELTTAYQFASVAAQRRLDAAEFFRKAARWAVFAAAFSWVAMIWAVWLVLRVLVPVWVPGIATAVVVLAAVALGRLGTREI